jgi:hypothetical protein
MRLRWILAIVAAMLSFLLTTIGMGLVFLMPMAASLDVMHFFNPGGLIVGLIWPDGPHSGSPLAAFSPLFLVAADLILWWVIIYFAVLAPLGWLWHRRSLVGK